MSRLRLRREQLEYVAGHPQAVPRAERANGFSADAWLRARRLRRAAAARVTMFMADVALVQVPNGDELTIVSTQEMRQADN